MKFGVVVPQEKLENASNHIGAVILSRFSSSRLPGKALKEINRKPVLQYIVERLKVVLSKQQIIIATSNEVSDDPIANFARESGVGCFRGSLENVSERFLLAAMSQGWDYVIRINGDNIFVDTEVLQNMVQLALAEQYDFISNVKGRTFPKGMSIEIVRVSYFQSVFPKMTTSPYHEHVTLYLYDHEEGKNHYYLYNRQLPEAANIQLALDTKEDFDRSHRIINRFTAPHWTYNLHGILEILKNDYYG